MTEEFFDKRTEFLKISDNIKRIREDIFNAEAKSGRREGSTRLMAVTKTVDAERINYAISCGIDLIGENKVQEFLSKREELDLNNAVPHLIGHLQTNKVSKIVGLVDMIQSVDSVRLADAVSKKSCELGIKTNILLEVNIGREESKTGIDPDALLEAAYEICEFKGITLCGLMAIPPAEGDISKKMQFFSNMFKLFIDIRDKKMDNSNVSILSMGMSGDYAAAVECGSNLVRVGSKIFGARNYNK